MGKFALWIAFFSSIACWAQQVDLPLLTIQFGGSKEAKVVLGPVDLDLAIDGCPQESVWQRGDIDVPYLKINPIVSANRAACATLSQKPARSFSVIIDTMNAARAAYRLGLATDHDPKIFTTMAVKRFRYSVMELLKLIATQIMEGKLPLLPHEDQGQLEKYSQAMEGCSHHQYCHGLDDYIALLWNSSNPKQIDSFGRQHFVRQKDLAAKGFEFGCYRQLKYSPLMANFLQSKPAKENFEEIAKAHINQATLLEECDQLYQVDSLESASFQGELLNIDENKWNKIGFDFWHSLKLYFSWAWRNASQMEEMIYPFGHVFRSVHLEDSVMLLPNGCNSITEPRCDGSFLNEQQLRDFAKKSYEDEVSAFDHLKFLPEGAAATLLDKNVSARGDVLDFGKFPSMEDWSENFRKNFTRSRGIMKGRLQSAATNLTLITGNLAPEDLIDDVKEIFEGSKPLESNIVDINLRHEIYYLCSEFTMINFDSLPYKEELLKLKEQNVVDAILKDLTGERIEKFYDYYVEVATGIKSFCDSLDRSAYWSQGDEEIDRLGYRDWMKELLYPNGYLKDSRQRTGRFKGTPLLAYGDFSFFKESERVICFNGIDCARNLLESMVKLYSVAQYTETYFAPFQKLQSGALENPYAEQTVCKVYDPWWKLKKGIFNLFADATLGLVSAFNPTPFYIDVDLKERKVSSFNELWEEGTLKLEPQFDKKRLLYWAGVEFGPLLGASCSLSISNHSTAGVIPKYYLTGITVGACGERMSNDLVTYTTVKEAQNEIKRMAGCFSCTLNFENVASEVATATQNPWIEAGFYLFRGVIRFFEGVFDPVDTPRSWTVDVNHVLETYRRYGEIPQKCESRLRQGLPCLENDYEYIATQVIQRDYRRGIKKMIRKGNRVEIDMHGCHYPVYDVSLKALTDGYRRGSYVEQLQNTGYCEWNR